MPARALRPCPHPGCSTLTRTGRCDAHRYAGEAHKRKPGERRFYDTALWRSRIRPMKLAENPLCEDCRERGLLVPAQHVDHIDGDTNDNRMEALRSLCASCHSRKTVQRDGGFGRSTPGGPN